MKWKKPTRSVMPRQEASTASRPRAKVSTSMISVSPSSARKKLMPSGAIQVRLEVGEPGALDEAGGAGAVRRRRRP